MCPTPSFNEGKGDEIVKANMDGDDTPSQSDQNDQGEEEEEIGKDKDFIIKTCIKETKTSPCSVSVLRGMALSRFSGLVLHR